MLMTFFIGLTGYATALVAQYLGAGRKRSLRAGPLPGGLPLVSGDPPDPGGPASLTTCSRSWTSSAATRPAEALFRHSPLRSDPGSAADCLSSFFSGIGQTRVVMFSALTAMLVNVAANYVLIFGHLGFPALGIRGAAYGTLFGSLCGLLVLLAAYLAPTNRREFGVALPRYDGEVMRKLLRFGYPAGVELFLNLLAFTSMILLFHSTASPRRRPSPSDLQRLGHGLLRAAARHPDRCRQPGRALHGCGPARIAERVTRSGLKMGCPTRKSSWSSSSASPNNWSRSFSPAARTPSFSGGSSRRRHARLAGLYVTAGRDDGGLSAAPCAAPGCTFWTMCISVGLHWLLLPVLFIL